MEQYKEPLKIQNTIIITCILVLAVFTFLGIAAEAGWVELTPVAGDSHWQSRWRGFISGASCGILVLMVYKLVRNMQALKDEKELKKLYIKEHDERTIQIWKEARNSGMVTFLLLGLVAAIVAGYFSIPISLAIVTCVVCCSLICVGFVFYYSKKY